MRFFALSVSLLCILCLSCTVPVKKSTISEGDKSGGQDFLVPDVDIKNVMVAPVSFSESITENTTDDYRKAKQDLLTSMVYDRLVLGEMEFSLIPLFATMKGFRELNNFTPGYNNPDNSLDVAREFNADTVFFTRVSRYIEREGSELGVDRPASVSFNAELYEVKSGKILWMYYYSETQQPLLHDVSKIREFVERGAKWVTADELIREGIKKAVIKLKKDMSKK